MSTSVTKSFENYSAKGMSFLVWSLLEILVFQTAGNSVYVHIIANICCIEKSNQCKYVICCIFKQTLVQTKSWWHYQHQIRDVVKH